MISIHLVTSIYVCVCVICEWYDAIGMYHDELNQSEQAVPHPFTNPFMIDSKCNDIITVRNNKKPFNHCTCPCHLPELK